MYNTTPNRKCVFHTPTRSPSRGGSSRTDRCAVRDCCGSELVALIDTIMRGVFRGDFSVALERAAAFCRVQVSGATHVADDYESTEAERASELTTRARRLHAYANDLSAAAGLWRVGGLN